MRSLLLSIPLLLVAVTAQAQSDAAAARARALYEEAFQAASDGNFQRAVELFKASLAAYPQNFLAAFDLGGAYEELGDKDQAMAAYTEAVRLRPDFAEAHNELGTLLLLHKRDNDRAITEFRAALLLPAPFEDPRFSPAQTRGQVLLNLAVAYAQKGQLGLAQGIARSLLADPGAETDADRARAIVRGTEEDLAPALRREHTAELDAIRAQLHGGKAEAALAAYAAFAEKNPVARLSFLDRWDLAEGLGLATAALGHHDDAVRLFRDARALAERARYPLLEESTYNLACALVQQGKLDDALTTIESLLWIEHVTRHDPERKPAARGESRLRYVDNIGRDPTLAPLRQRKELGELLTRYGFSSGGAPSGKKAAKAGATGKAGAAGKAGAPRGQGAKGASPKSTSKRPSHQSAGPTR